MLMDNLIECSDAYLKKSGCLWQYYRDEPILDNSINIIDFPANNKNSINIIDFPANNNNSIPFKFKEQVIIQTGNGGTKYVEIMV